MEERRILYRDDEMVVRLEKGWVVRVYFKSYPDSVGYHIAFDGERYRLFEQWNCQVKDLDPRHWDWDKYAQYGQP